MSGPNTHHVLQESLVNHPIIQLLGGRRFIEQNFNKLNLPSDIAVAFETGTQVHLGDHYWVRDAQKEVLDQYLNSRVDGVLVSEIIKNKSSYPAQYEAVTQRAVVLVNDLRDVTAMSIINRDLPLTYRDLLFPNMSEADVRTRATQVLAPERFALTADGTATAASADLTSFRNTRQSILDAGGDVRWMTLDSPEKVTAYFNAVEHNATNGARLTSSRASLASLTRYMTAIDPEGVGLRGISAAARMPRSFGVLPMPLKIVVLAGALSMIATAAEAATATSQAERNDILQDAAVGLGIELVLAATGMAVLPATLLAMAAYLVYEYNTNPEFEQMIDGQVELARSLLPQVVSRIYNGESIVPEDIGVQYVPAPGADPVPVLGSLHAPVQTITGIGQESTINYFTGLAADLNRVQLVQNHRVEYTASNGNRVTATIDAVFVGPSIIGFIIRDENALDMPVYSGSQVAYYEPATNGKLFLSGPNKPSSGDISFLTYGTNGSVEGPVADVNLLAEAILNTGAQKGVPSPELDKVQEISNSPDLSVATITYAVTNRVEIRVARRGSYDLPLNSATSTSQYIIEDRFARSPNGSYEFTRIVKDPNGQPLQTDTVTMIRDSSGFHVVGGTVEPETAADMEARASTYEPGFSGEATRAVAAERGRDASHAVSRGPEPTSVPIAYFRRQGDRIADVATRIVADRLSTRGDTTDIETFNNAYRDQVRTIEIAGSIGQVFGSVLGQALAGDDRLAQLALGGALGALTQSAGQAVAAGFAADSLKQGVDTGSAELPDNLANAAAGALSSLLTAELINAIGLDGFAGELFNTVAGSTLNTLASNLRGLNGPELMANPFSNIASPATLGTAVASFLGSKLASEIVSFDTVGGQLGAALGSSLGAIGVTGAITAAGTAHAALLGVQLGTWAGPLAALAGAFLGFIAGGLIGSLFGGTPRSGADVVWDPSRNEFVTANVYSRYNGSKDGARGLAGSVSGALNGLVKATGGELLNPEAIQSGNYGMRKKDFVYRPYSTRDEAAISHTFSGEDGAKSLVSYGVLRALSDPDFLLAGGDAYTKRAIYARVAEARASGTLDLDSLLGDLQVAHDWSFYRNNPGIIEAVAGTKPEGKERNTYLAGWAITTVRARELGLDRRAVSDWYGGFNYLFEQTGANAGRVEFFFDYDINNDRFSRVQQFDRYQVGDGIDVAGQDLIQGTASNDLIVLQGASIVSRNEVINSDLTVNGRPWDGRVKTVEIAAIIEAGAGGDTVHASDRGDNVFGGTGNDTLYGGRLDDWLLGEDGNDTLDAGSATPGTLGGDGNYLNGGVGDDILRGREGSDWLDGGNGVDQLEGGAGDDVLVGGSGEGDTLHGGTGSDQYVFRRGDGHDILKDESDISLAAQAVQARLAGLSSGAIQRNWAGSGQAVQDLIAGGEDAIVFGDGIGFRDVILRRSSVNGQPGADLIIELTTIDANGAQLAAGDALTVQNWFDDTRRIEWLKFADGTELRVGDVTSFIIGTAGDDILIGMGGADFLAGGDGNDTMRGLGGDDFGFGGRGKDLIAGDDDDDWLVGGDDDDQVIGGLGNDTLFGDAGNDKAYGGAGRDLISGGRGNDQLVGGAGNDVFRFQRGDGRDVLFDDYAQNWELVWEQGYYVNGYTLVGSQVIKDGVVYYGDDNAWNGLYDWQDSTKRFYRNLGGTLTNSGDDTLEFGLDIGIQNLQLKRSGNDLLLAVESGDAGSFALIADQILLKDWYATGTPIEHFVLIDVGRLDLSEWSIGAAVTDGDDTVQGGAGTDWVTGGLGNDTLAGGGGNDILSGNAGNDTLRGESGADILFGGSGNDLLDGGAGPDELNGGSGIDIASYASSSGGVQASLANSAFNGGEAAADKYIDIEGLEGGAASDTLSGDDSENILRGLGGNDLLKGGAGDDSYEIGANEGADVIEDGVFVIEQIIDASGNLDRARFVASWEYLGVQSEFGTWHAYSLTVRRLSDSQIVYESREGVDFLYQTAQAGLPGGTTWPFSDGQWKLGAARTGNGVQTIVSAGGTGDGGLDAIDFASGVGLSDLTAAWENNGADLRISIAGGGSVLLRNQADPDRRIESIIFADGLNVDLTALRLPGGTLGGSDDFFLGGAGADSVAGGAGDDVIAGGAGDDLLSGDDGDDILEGGAGADVLSGGSDSIAAGHVALANDPSRNYGDTVRYTRSAQAISVFLTSGIAVGGDAEGDTLSGIENVTGSEAGNDFVDGSSAANRLLGLGGADILIGNGGDDVLIGGDGNDSLQGGDGDDAISGDAGVDSVSGGAGNDVMSGGEGGDTVSGGIGNDRLNGDGGGDTLRGDAGDDILSGGDGDDFLYGGAGSDTLVGGTGMDTVSGDDGNDILTGGAENDLLQGGYGNDTYAFDAAAGANRILDKVGSNRILFSGVSFDQIWLSRSGSDLLVQAIGTSAAITVQGYFAASAPSLMTSITTGNHTLFLSGAAALIDAMTAVGALPSAMPQSVKDQLTNHWVTASSAPHVSDQSRTTNEDTALSGTVGAVDEEGDISAYAVSTTPVHGAVSIHASTGAWTYTPTANWNGTDGFDIRVTDAEGHTAVQHVAVVVVPVNDGPGAVTSGALSVNEMAQDGDLAGVISATDPDDAASALTYSLVGNAGGRFRIDADGSLRVNRTPAQIASGLLLDHEAASSHLVRVRVTDAAGLWREQDLTVTVGDTNEAPVDITIGSLLEIFEAPPQTMIGRVNASDPEGNIVSYELIDSAGGRFVLGIDGYLRVGPAGLDYETASSHAIVIRATDAGGLTYDKAFTITVKDWNEAPLAISADGTLAFAENSGIGSSLVRFTGSDPDNNIADYSLTNNAGGRFAITSSGQLVVGAAGLNYEAGASHTITVRVIDAGELSYEQDFVVSLTNVNEAPTHLLLDNDTFNENIAVGEILTAFEVFDPEEDSVTYSLVDSAGGRFTIDEVNGWLKVGPAGLDHETSPGHMITVRATDVGGLSIVRSFAVTIANVNEAPTDIVADRTLVFDEDRAVGDLLAVLSGVDPESNVVALELVNDADGRFSLDPDRSLRVGPAGLDYEAGAHTIVVRARDANGLTFDKSLTIRVADINEAPTDVIATGALVFAENQAPGTSLVSFIGVDPEGGSLTYSLRNDAGGRFAVSTAGELTVGAAGLDHEAGAIQSILVRVADSSGLSYGKWFDITVANVNEAPTSITAPVLAVVENAGPETILGTVSAADADTPSNGLRFTLDDDSNGRFSITQAGQIRATGLGSLSYEDSDELFVVVRVTDSGGLYLTRTVAIDVTDVNEAPTSLTLASSGAVVTERDHVGDGPLPGAINLGVLSAIDPDLPTAGDFATLLFSVADQERFEILSGNQLWLKAGVRDDIDYETDPVLSVAVTVTDRGGHGLSYVRTLTFAIADQVDRIVGTAGGDSLTGQVGRDIMHGYGGVDVLQGGAGDDDLFGGDGADRLYGGDGADKLFGELSDDKLYGGAGDDQLSGGEGDDTVLDGGEGNDTLWGGTGLDTLTGGLGDDQLFGEGDNDALDGGAGADRLEGGAGEDVLAGGAGADHFLGGEGDDVVTYAGAGAGVKLDLAAAIGLEGDAQGDVFEDHVETLVGSSHGDEIIGSALRDLIYGGEGGDIIHGGGGDDEIFGGGGDDYINAENGGDQLDGGIGSDTLVGGSGNDIYLMHADSGTDDVYNYDASGTDFYDTIGYQGIGREQLWFERSGDDLIVSAIGTSTVTTVKDYFVDAAPGDLANFKIDFITTLTHETDSTNLEGLLALMAGYAKPADAQAYRNLHDDLVFENQWQNFWDDNGAPTIGDLVMPAIAEDQYNDAQLPLSVQITDFVTPATGITVAVTPVNGNTNADDTSVIQSVTIGGPDSEGNRLLNIRTRPGASGAAAIRIVAVDPGGLATEKIIRFNVDPVADAPVITRAQPETPTGSLLKPTLVSGGWDLDLQAALQDQDGSEVLEMRISGVPAGLSFNHGSNLGGGVWSIPTDKLDVLRLLGPATWSQDITLTVTATAREEATGATASTTATLNMVINARPTDLVPDRTVVVNEMAGVDTLVANFSTTDADVGDTRSYSLQNDAGGRFKVDGATGALKVLNGTLLNYEANTNHNIVIRVTDSGGLIYDETVSVTVANVNEAPTDIAADRALTFTENTPVGTVLAQFSGTDPESNITGYTLFNDAGGRFTITANGQLRVGAASLDFEASPTRTIIVRATDAGGLIYDESFTVTIANINEAPTDIVADRPLSFAENIAVSTIVAEFAAVDPEGNVASYSLVNNAGGRFTLDGNKLKVGSAGLNHEIANTVSIAIRATDAAGLWFEKTLAVNITNVNESPTDIVADRALTINENTLTGTLIAKVTGVDPEGNVTGYELVNDTSGRLTLTSAGELKVGAAGLDYETNPAIPIIIRITDAGGFLFDKMFTVTLGNVNEAPVDIIANGPLNFAENLALGSNLVRLTANDPEANATSLELRDDAGGRFTLDANGWLKVGATGLNFEVATSHTIVVRATDAGGLFIDKAFTIGISDVNEAPVNITADRVLAFSENTPVGNGLAWFVGADPDNNITSYSLADSAGGRFAMDTNGLLKVGSAGLNFETSPSATIVVRATDSAGAIFDKAFTIGISDVNEAPVNITADRALAFNENTPVGNGLAWFVGADPDNNITSYSLADSAGGRFAMDTNGLLKVGSAGLNFETGPSATIVVRATDSAGAIFDKAFTIAISDVNEAPVNITADRALAFNENTPVGNGLAWFLGADPDGGVLSYSLVNDAAGRFTLDSNGLLKVGGTGLDYEVGSTPTIVVRVTDAAGLVFDKAFTVTIGNVNEVPTDLWADRTLSFEENIAPGTGLAWFGAADPDGGALSYALISDTGGRFAVRSDGLLMVGSAGFNFEAATGPTQSILVRVTDASGAYRDEWFSTAITDLNEAPVISGGSFAIGERDSGPGTIVGTVSGWDPDAPNTANSKLAYSLSGAGAEKFAISSTGVISYHQGDIDQDVTGAVSDYALTVTVADQNGAGLSASAPVNIHINAQNEAPYLIAASVHYYTTNPYNVVLAVQAADPEGDTNFTFSAVRTAESGGGPPGPLPGNNYWTIYQGSSAPNFTGIYDITSSDGTTSRTQRVTVNGHAGTIGPVVLDLDGDGIELRSSDDARILFDMTGDGNPEPSGWVAADDAVLVLDRNGNGIIDNGSELSLTADQGGAVSDLEGLRSYDSNGNGFFDISDARFDAFRLWRDINQDGISQAEELSSLSAHGIVALNLTLTRTNEQIEGDTGNFLYGTTEFTRGDGTTGTVGDVFLGYQTVAIDIEGVEPVPAGAGPSEDDRLAAPIILDLDGDAKTIVPLAESATLFDMAGDGQRHKTAWADAGDGFLVRDRNGNGVIDNIAEISFVGDKAGAQTDLEGLAGFDGNGDKILDASDSSFTGFAIWKDANANGRTDAGELQSLADAGVRSINLVGTPTGQTAAQRTGGQSVIFNTAAFTRADGSAGSLSDAGLAFDAAGLGAVSAWTAKPTLANDRFDLKSGKARISAANGQLIVRQRSTDALFDPSAGAMAAATFIKFRDKTVGMLGALVLDLDGDGLDLEHQRNSRASFDMDSNGGRDNTGWVAKGDGFLVIDRNGDGRVGSGAELSFLGEKSGALTNFEALAVLDGNRDGKLNVTDMRFGELKVWFDRDLNGVSEGGELQTLASLGITEIGVRAFATQIANQRIGSNIALSTATFTQNGKTKTIGDVAFAFSPAAHVPVLSASRRALPGQLDLDERDMLLPDALADMVNPLDTRLALMRQAMNGFGTGSATEARLDKAGIAPAYDFYAASAA